MCQRPPSDAEKHDAACRAALESLKIAANVGTTAVKLFWGALPMAVKRELEGELPFLRDLADQADKKLKEDDSIPPSTGDAG